MKLYFNLKKFSMINWIRITKVFSFTALLSLLVLSLQAQEITKMNIKDLESYIQKSEHPLVVNFWATFCVPCVKEIPTFEKIISTYKDKQVELILVSLDLPDSYPAKIENFARDRQFSSSIIWLNETNADYFCPRIDKKWSGGIPSSLFINNRNHFKKFFESELNANQFEENIKKMVE
ncbi:MAG: thioredoxin [Bacteroidetes bacterium]|nr:MAG: thioredoxin [Bacteroidota bacterium]